MTDRYGGGTHVRMPQIAGAQSLAWRPCGVAEAGRAAAVLVLVLVLVPSRTVLLMGRGDANAPCTGGQPLFPRLLPAAESSCAALQRHRR